MTAHVVLAVALSLLAARAPAPIGSGPAGEFRPIGGGPPPVGGTPALGATAVAPVPGLVDVRPAAWVHVRARAGGRQLVVRFWSTPCHELDRVDVDAAHDPVVITLYQGVRPEQRGKPCMQLAESRAVTVELEESIAGRRVVDGAGAKR